MGQFEGKIAVVTGGGTGIGLASACRLASKASRKKSDDVIARPICFSKSPHWWLICSTAPAYVCVAFAAVRKIDIRHRGGDLEFLQPRPNLFPCRFVCLCANVG